MLDHRDQIVNWSTNCVLCFQLLRNQQGVQLVFQEPGAPPFTPIGPSPQGVYLVVRVHGLGTAELCYRSAATFFM